MIPQRIKGNPEKYNESAKNKQYLPVLKRMKPTHSKESTVHVRQTQINNKQFMYPCLNPETVSKPSL